MVDDRLEWLVDISEPDGLRLIVELLIATQSISRRETRP